MALSPDLLREARNEPSHGGRGGGRRFGLGRGGGGRGYVAPRTSGTRRGVTDEVWYNHEKNVAEEKLDGEDKGMTLEEYQKVLEAGRQRRAFDRHSGTGHGVTEEVSNETEKNVAEEKPAGEEDAAAEGNKETPAIEAEEKEPEDKEMTLEEYEKVLEEKRKALQALKTEGRKVDTKEFESMKPLSRKKENDEIFAKMGSDKDKRKDAFEKEKARKALSINEFLKPAGEMTLEEYQKVLEAGRQSRAFDRHSPQRNWTRGD
ncbi:hypothetical protein P8452_73523 [Trifolium repens]|nr:hypothetical protein P8452_73521 [Trifolium repens]WJX91796.1 hypothetical protein P8452_73523 [Trifolium repens]